MIEITKRFIETYKSMGLNGYKMNKACPVLSKQKFLTLKMESMRCPWIC